MADTFDLVDVKWNRVSLTELRTVMKGPKEELDQLEVELRSLKGASQNPNAETLKEGDDA